MKAFNKLFSMAVASVLVFSLAGCGDKEETKKFTANLNGSEIAVTYTYKGDKVLKQTSENKIMYSSINAANKEDAAKILDPISAKYKNLGKRTARAVLTGMCYSAGSAMRHGSSSLTRLTGQSAMTPSTWRR